MFLGSSATERIAADTRTLAAHLDSAVDQLTLTGWCGPDAASFRARWSAQVTEPLRAAANALDGFALDEAGALLGELFHV